MERTVTEKREGPQLSNNLMLSRTLTNPAPAEDLLVIVQNEGLTGRNAKLRFSKFDVDLVEPGSLNSGGGSGVLIPNLCQTFDTVWQIIN